MTATDPRPALAAMPTARLAPAAGALAAALAEDMSAGRHRRRGPRRAVGPGPLGSDRRSLSPSLGGGKASSRVQTG